MNISDGCRFIICMILGSAYVSVFCRLNWQIIKYQIFKAHGLGIQFPLCRLLMHNSVCARVYSIAFFILFIFISSLHTGCVAYVACMCISVEQFISLYLGWHGGTVVNAVASQCEGGISGGSVHL